MKKFLLSTLIGTTLMSTITGGSLAFAESQKQSVQVNYQSIPEIATSEYMVSIPQTIQFTSDKEGVDLKIELFSKDGTEYTGNGVNIGIESANGFKLTSKDASLPYSLTYENIVFSSGDSQSQINLGTSKRSITGKARINATTTIKPGNYADTLTYTVTGA